MARLKISRDEAENVIGRHFNEGEALRQEAVEENRLIIPDEGRYREWRQSQRRWIQRTKAGLGYVYEEDQAADEFDKAADPPVYIGGFDDWRRNLQSDYEDVGNGLNVLTSLIERLMYDEAPEQPATAAEPAYTDQPVIFLVHGQDHGKRDTVALFLQNAGPPGEKPVVLEELANKGRTLIEKLEQHARDSKFAVVLLTGDDVGRAADAMRDDEKPRARQNVILELGWFCGLLGRNNVAVLYEPEVELPSDIDGLAYISLAGEWQNRLALELTTAGYDYSIDRLTR